MTWNLARPALFVLIATVALLAPQFADRAHAASTISVNTSTDDVDPNNVLSLREAMMLAIGDRSLADLTEAECAQVNPSQWSVTMTCTDGPFPAQPPGPNSSDTIVFNPAVFPPGNPQAIALGSTLPTLDTGGDTIDGSGAGVIIDGVDKSFTCIVINSSFNSIKGLQVTKCHFGINVFRTIGPVTDNNTIGGTTPEERNVIHDNNHGLLLNGEVTGNRVIGNYIGTNATGTAASPNNVGVFIGHGADLNLIGGDTPEERNVISGSTKAGVEIFFSNENTVSGNYIGTDVNGSAAIPNSIGVTVDNSDGNTIGGDGAGEGNLISGNNVGVDILDDSLGNMVVGNLIGTDAAGENAVPNTHGVQIRGGASNNVIGGSTTAARNVISGSLLIGVFIQDPGTDGNIVSGNYIGTDASGEAALGNDIGINIYNGPQDTLVGGTTEGERNVIADSRFGVLIHTGVSQNNTVIGNYIGTGASGENALPNETGVEISIGALNNTIGGVAPGEGNLIAFNTEVGVRVDGEFGDAAGNTIRGNSIHSNGGKGIENLNNGNLELPPPVITGFGSVAGTACAACTIDLYSDNEDEGAVYEGATTADANGDWTFPGNPAGPNVTATATDTAGNTSEFSDEAAAPEPTPTPSPTPTPTGQTPTPTPAPTATPPPTGEPTLIQGDNDCDGDSDSVDALRGLQHIAAIDFSQEPGCPTLGGALPAALPAGAGPDLFGDVDCDNDVDSVDQLKILRKVAALSISQNEPCADIGDPL